MKHLWKIPLLALIFTSSSLFACSFCRTGGKGAAAPAPKPAAAPVKNETGLLSGARIIGAAKESTSNFSEGFFKDVGDDQEKSTQPVAVPNGDDGSFKVIFQ
jgi:hypothetical protein